MKIELRNITVRELAEGYKENGDEGVVGYGGRLDIRPPYQREFVYGEKERDAVIATIQKGFPLNIMYWAVNDNAQYEVLDGQQRTISICRYVAKKFSIGSMYFHTISREKQEQILNYTLTVYCCEGTDDEKLDWFKIVNLAGKELTPQELRNAVYRGTWLTDAKRKFSRNGCPAYKHGSKYIADTISPIRQEYLELAIKWMVNDSSESSIKDYMADHQHDADAEELWQYFWNVIEWIKKTFPERRKEMKGVNWGDLYHRFGSEPPTVSADELEKRIKALMMDDEVENRRGIYEYVLSGDERCLCLRAFSEKVKREVYERQDGICAECGKKFEFETMEGDHITPWHAGGLTVAENCQMLCKTCNRKKGKKSFL